MYFFLIIGIAYSLFLLFLPFILHGLSRRLDKLEEEQRELGSQLRTLQSKRAEPPAPEPQEESPPRSVPAAAPSEPPPAVSREAWLGHPETPTEPIHTLAELPGGKEGMEAEAEPAQPATTAPAREPAEELDLWPAPPPQPRRKEVGERPPVDLVALAREWLLGGNTVARVGVIVLFFGVAFFLKYAIEQGWLPIEVRLAGAALGGIALVVTGWHLRQRRRNYGLVLQGGGVGIVYLTVFAAVDLYAQIPAPMALMLMVTLVALTSALAVLQDARSLAVLAAVGGFLAPVLVSSNGNHVVLFSYYLALDLGILAIAWFRAWRELNLVGFLFTFVIGGIWGYRYYQPEFFTTTEPFLLLFFVLYVAIPVLFARQLPSRYSGYVDGTLIFGVPLVAFGLQAALVHDQEYGTAISALCAGLFYATLATLLWRKRTEQYRLVTETFISLAVAFGTLAIPLAVDGRWTGTAWALEGAALVWVGMRQQNRLSRFFGLVIQYAAGIAFLTDIHGSAADTPVLNSLYLSALMISLAALFSSYYTSHHRERLHETEYSLANTTLGWGLLWWFGAGLNEITRHAPYLDRADLSLIFIALSAAALGRLRTRLAWEELRYPAMGFVMVVAAFTLLDWYYHWVYSQPGHPFERWGIIAWALTFAVHYALLRRFETEWSNQWTNFGHQVALWCATLLLALEASWQIALAVPESRTWGFVAWGILPAAVVLALPKLCTRISWPLRRFRAVYLGDGLAPLILFLGLWLWVSSTHPGDPSPLSYFPVLNPLELVQLFVLLAGYHWLHISPLAIKAELRWGALGALAFVVLNSIIARAVHFLGDVPFNMTALWQAAHYQTAVSITWTVVALALTVSATRLQQRIAWLTGGALLAAVVVKLFVIDLAGVGTIARIVSFIVVGVLLLLVGYLSPLPPRAQQQKVSA